MARNDQTDAQRKGAASPKPRGTVAPPPNSKGDWEPADEPGEGRH